jgi:hypothetical protein
VNNGILRGVSFGYEVLEEEYIEAGESKDGFVGPAVLVTRWRALEISLTPVPADFTVGVGRSRGVDDLDSDTEGDSEAEDEVPTKDVIADVFAELRTPADGEVGDDENEVERAIHVERARSLKIRQAVKAGRFTQDAGDDLIESGVEIED